MGITQVRWNIFLRHLTLAKTCVRFKTEMCVASTQLNHYYQLSFEESRCDAFLFDEYSKDAAGVPKCLQENSMTSLFEILLARKIRNLRCIWIANKWQRRPKAKTTRKFHSVQCDTVEMRKCLFIVSFRLIFDLFN